MHSKSVEATAKCTADSTPQKLKTFRFKFHFNSNCDKFPSTFPTEM